MEEKVWTKRESLAVHIVVIVSFLSFNIALYEPNHRFSYYLGVQLIAGVVGLVFSWLVLFWFELTEELKRMKDG